MIKVLDKSVADKIAAGEVVDRPLSIIKELVENSIDAGARSITIEIKKGGKEYLRVTDNGCGIEKNQVLTAFLRHATSKIVSDKDLENIGTLGFRGEALASIAAVSMVEMITKTPDSDTGSKAIIRGGEVVENCITGCQDGTTVVVTELFYNTPARLKFMKSDGAESSLIIDFISQMALAYPDIKIRLINNETTLFSTNGKGNRYNNILTVYSSNTGSGLVPVDYEEAYVKVSGYVSGPKESRSSRRSQIFFVNGRVVGSKVLEKGINAAYSDRLFPGRYPIAFLFVSVPSDRLDVNIHPNKRQVRFNDEQLVSDAVAKAVRLALATKEAVPDVTRKDIKKTSENIFVRKYQEENHGTNINNVHEKDKTASDKNTNVINCKSVKVIKEKQEQEQVDIKSLLSRERKIEDIKSGRTEKIAEDDLNKTYIQNAERNSEFNGEIQERSDAADKDKTVSGEITPEKKSILQWKSLKAPELKPFDFDELKVQGCIFNTYIMATDGDCFYLIDQHAAHERVFFEKLLDQYESSEKLVQPIMLPFTVNVPYQVSEAKTDWMDILKAYGYDIEEFGPKTYRVSGIPMFMDLAEATDFVDYFIENITDNTDLESQSQLEKIMQRSCKSAVKGGDRLAPEEIDGLMRSLKACRNPFSCPHGRPTFIKMSRYEIEKMFKRV